MHSRSGYHRQSHPQQGSIYPQNVVPDPYQSRVGDSLPTFQHKQQIDSFQPEENHNWMQRTRSTDRLSLKSRNLNLGNSNLGTAEPKSNTLDPNTFRQYYLEPEEPLQGFSAPNLMPQVQWNGTPYTQGSFGLSTPFEYQGKLPSVKHNSVVFPVDMHGLRVSQQPAALRLPPRPYAAPKITLSFLPAAKIEQLAPVSFQRFIRGQNSLLDNQDLLNAIDGVYQMAGVRTPAYNDMLETAAFFANSNHPEWHGVQELRRICLYLGGYPLDRIP